MTHTETIDRLGLKLVKRMTELEPPGQPTTCALTIYLASSRLSRDTTDDLHGLHSDLLLTIAAAALLAYETWTIPSCPASRDAEKI